MGSRGSLPKLMKRHSAEGERGRHKTFLAHDRTKSLNPHISASANFMVEAFACLYSWWLGYILGQTFEEMTNYAQTNGIYNIKASDNVDEDVHCDTRKRVGRRDLHTVSCFGAGLHETRLGWVW